MGLYINPKDTTKEQWLAKHGTLLNKPPDSPNPIHGLVAVCLVNNGAFTAAGVMYDQEELDSWRYPGDHRPKIWYLVGMDDILDVCGKTARRYFNGS